MAEQSRIGVVTQWTHIWWNFGVSVGEVTMGPLQRALNLWHPVSVDTDHTRSLSVLICVYVCACEEAIVWKAQPPLSWHSKWQHLFLFFLRANASVAPSPLCSTPPFGADISTHHWSRRQTNGNPPACWNYWWLSFLSPSPPAPYLAYSLSFCPFSCASVCFSHSQTTSLPFQLLWGWGFTLFLLTPFIFSSLTSHSLFAILRASPASGLRW